MTWLAADAYFGPRLFRDVTVSELVGRMDETGVDSVVLVQAASDVAETEKLLALADENDRVMGVVGWVSLAGTEVTRRELDRVAGSPKLVGIRHNDGWLPDGDVLLDGRAWGSAELIAEHGLVLDLQTSDRSGLPAVAELARRLPQLTIVLNHLGKVDVTDPAAYDPWARDLASVADHSNVVVKYSGWSTRLPHPDPGLVSPYLRHALASFGEDRVVFGSNWPVSTMSGTYGDVLDASVAALTAVAGPVASAQVLADNARRIYSPRDNS